MTEDMVSQLVQNLPTDISEIEGTRTTVLSEGDIFKSFENAFYDTMPDDAVDDETKLRAGTGNYVLGKDTAAHDALQGVDHPAAGYIRARHLASCGLWSKAREELAPALKKSPDSLPVRMLDIECLALAGDAEGAAAHIEFLQQNHPDAPELPYATGLIAEAQGEYEDATRQYQAALAIDDAHQASLFRLAFGESLRGDPENAIDLYERLCNLQPTSVGALINLGVLLEDQEQYALAVKAFRRVLSFDPNNARARLYHEDAVASTSMFYDEEKERKEDKRAQVLRIPVTDFELSVRSRNCLANMNVRTLGDLIRLSEQELLSFKNFGETSLAEIKAILAQKGLRLGMLPREESSGIIMPPVDVDRDSALSRPVGDLDLSVRSRKALDTLTITTIEDLTNVPETRLLACKNFGQTSLVEIKKKLSDLGLSLKG